MRNINLLLIILFCVLQTISSQQCGSSFREDFQSFSINNKFICQLPTNPCWTTWSGNRSCFGNSEDPFFNVTGSNKYLCISSDNCVSNGSNDLVRYLSNSTTGIEEFGFDISVRNGRRGFITFLHEFNQNVSNSDDSWAFDLQFEDCIFYINLHERTTSRRYAFSTYNHDQWYNVKVILNYSSDEAQIVFNNQVTFKFKISTYYSRSTLNNKYIRAVDFYGISCSHFFIDNVYYTPSGNPNVFCNVSPTILSYNNGDRNIPVTINSNTSWTIERQSGASWVHFESPSDLRTIYSSSGGPKDVYIWVDENPSSTPRTSFLTFKCSNGLTEIIQISQSEADYCGGITPSPVYSNSNANSFNLTINTNSTWSISIPSNIDWVRFLGNNVNINGFGSSTFAINLQSNIASSTRTAKLNVNCGGFISELSIVQEGRTGSNCNISPSLMSFSDQAGSQYFSISSSSNWSLSTSSGTTGWWSILDNGIEKNLPLTGNSIKTLELRVTPNNSQIPRNLELIFFCGGTTQKINISQAFNPITGSPCWSNPVITDKRHIVLIPYNVQVDLNGNNLDIGDWIGFYYIDNNIEYLAGHGEWKGADLAITLFGDSDLTNGKNGFSDKEKFIIKICRKSNSQVVAVTGIYSNAGVGRFTDEDCFKSGGFSGILRLEAKTNCVRLPIKAGYNLVSSYLEPQNPSILNIFSLRNGDVTVLDQEGKVSIPALNIDNIFNWDIRQGYEVRSRDSFIIDKVFCGNKVDPSVVELDIPDNKWRIISYLRDTPKAIDSVFAAYRNRIFAVKDEVGNFYMPFLGIDRIGNMLPLKGYFIYSQAPFKFKYPKFDSDVPQVRGIRKYNSWEAEHFKFMPFANGNNCVIVIPKEVVMENCVIGDEVGVFNIRGQLLGSSRCDGNSMAITVWGIDDGCQRNCDGFMEEDKMQFRIWKNSTGITKEVIPILENGELSIYRKDKIYFVSKFESNSAVKSRINYYFSDNELNFIDLERANIEVYNCFGQLCKSCNITSEIKSISLNNYPAGIYFINILKDDEVSAVRIYKQ
ncbi:MAG: hypothetical protein IPI30_20785 [Saprospiraceae bacterium]|nr:hypothetical protein [Candidatus Vicinibacter affinis]